MESCHVPLNFLVPLHLLTVILSTALYVPKTCQGLFYLKDFALAALCLKISSHHLFFAWQTHPPRLISTVISDRCSLGYPIHCSFLLSFSILHHSFKYNHKLKLSCFKKKKCVYLLILDYKLRNCKIFFFFSSLLFPYCCRVRSTVGRK